VRAAAAGAVLAAAVAAVLLRQDVGPAWFEMRARHGGVVFVCACVFGWLARGLLKPFFVGVLFPMVCDMGSRRQTSATTGGMHLRRVHLRHVAGLPVVLSGLGKCLDVL
jgi:hypothetical protein